MLIGNLLYHNFLFVKLLLKTQKIVESDGKVSKAKQC